MCCRCLIDVWEAYIYTYMIRKMVKVETTHIVCYNEKTSHLRWLVYIKGHFGLNEVEASSSVSISYDL